MRWSLHAECPFILTNTNRVPVIWDTGVFFIYELSDARTVPALQFVDTLVHVVKETLFGDPQSVDARLLQCIHLFDLTHPVKTTRSA